MADIDTMTDELKLIIFKLGREEYGMGHSPDTGNKAHDGDNTSACNAFLYQGSYQFARQCIASV